MKLANLKDPVKWLRSSNFTTYHQDATLVSTKKTPSLINKRCSEIKLLILRKKRQFSSMQQIVNLKLIFNTLKIFIADFIPRFYTCILTISSLSDCVQLSSLHCFVNVFKNLFEYIEDY